MPYTSDEVRTRLQRTYKNVSAIMVRQFMEVFNKILRDTGSEKRAFAGAYAAINKRGVGKKRAASLSPIREVVMAVYALKVYEVAADRVAEIIGGTAKVWGPDKLLIEDAGAGLHLFFTHHGEVLEIEAGNGHPSQMVQWLETRAYEMAKDDGALGDIDFKQVVNDPNAFAQFLAAVFQAAGLRARSQGTKAVVAGRRDIVKVIEALFNRMGRQAIQAYFSESGGATEQPVKKPKEEEEPTPEDEEEGGGGEKPLPEEEEEDLGSLDDEEGALPERSGKKKKTPPPKDEEKEK